MRTKVEHYPQDSPGYAPAICLRLLEIPTDNQMAGGLLDGRPGVLAILSFLAGGEYWQELRKPTATAWHEVALNVGMDVGSDK